MIPAEELLTFERELNSMDPAVRENAVTEICELLALEEVSAKPQTVRHNLHCHTFFSYNGYGYSPSYIAWLARKEGFFAAGTVDFDVLDGVDEFLKAARKLNVRFTSGMETRVYVPEMADKEINSPGEPGIAYHLGVGFVSGVAPDSGKKFLASLKDTANARTRDIVGKVNAYLAPVSIDFEKDAASLTPAGNVTERHVCEAYYNKAREVFPDAAKRAEFWAAKLKSTPEEMKKIVDDPNKLQGLIRAKTMKSGGPGYVKADPKSFPTLAEMNEFILSCGAIPSMAWLNGESAGESDPDALLDLHIARKGAGVCVIPDRNWNFPDPAVKEKKVRELDRLVKAAIKRDMPVFIGTEMNAPGQKLVDDFDEKCLAPYVDCFAAGAAISFAHSLLQRNGMGYLSPWAASSFKSAADKNKFFAQLGKALQPAQAVRLKKASPEMSPADVLKMAQ